MPLPGNAIRRLIVAITCAAALAVFFAARVATSFVPQRMKLVTETRAPATGSVGVPVPPRSDDSFRGPVAVIARIANRSGRVLAFSLSLDGRPFCSRSVGPGEHRVDCAIVGGLEPGRSHTIGIESGIARDGPWELEYLEIATHHGATRAYDLVVVPDLLESYGRPGAAATAVVFLALAALLSLPAGRMSRRVRLVFGIAAGVVLAFLLLVALAPLVSQYLVLLSPRWFAAAGLLLVVPRLGFLWTWLGTHMGHRARRQAALLLATVGVVILPYSAVVNRLLVGNYDGNYSGFLQISQRLYDRNPLLNGRDEVRQSIILSPSGGYDGQFVYFAAFDPLVTRFRGSPATYSEFIDAPPYRLARIGLSWVAVLLSGGNWQYFPAAMIWAILGALGGLTASLATLRPGGDPNPLLGGLVLLVPGFWQSVQLCLPEPLAALLIVGGFAAMLRDRPALAGLLCGFSLFFRETGGIFVLLMLSRYLVQGRPSSAARFASLALLPYLAWRLHVGAVLAPEWGIHAYWLNVNNLGVPFSGLFDLLSRVGRGEYYPADPSVGRAAVWFSGLLGLALAAGMFAAVRSKSIAAIAAVVYGLIAVSLTFDSIWVHVGNGQRGSFELFVALALVSATTAKEERAVRWALAIVWLAAAGYVLFGGFDAGLIRSTIF